ncbi:MAG: DUF1016 N-terminal domain-containing protein [Niabella sp.]
MKVSKTKYNELLDNIGSTLQKAREKAVKAVNNELVKANWKIGQYIVEYEQHGKEKAEYGSSLLTNLAKASHLSASNTKLRWTMNTTILTLFSIIVF